MFVGWSLALERQRLGACLRPLAPAAASPLPAWAQAKGERQGHAPGMGDEVQVVSLGQLEVALRAGGGGQRGGGGVQRGGALGIQLLLPLLPPLPALLRAPADRCQPVLGAGASERVVEGYLQLQQRQGAAAGLLQRGVSPGAPEGVHVAVAVHEGAGGALDRALLLTHYPQQRTHLHGLILHQALHDAVRRWGVEAGQLGRRGSGEALASNSSSGGGGGGGSSSNISARGEDQHLRRVQRHERHLQPVDARLGARLRRGSGARLRRGSGAGADVQEGNAGVRQGDGVTTRQPSRLLGAQLLHRLGRLCRQQRRARHVSLDACAQAGSRALQRAQAGAGAGSRQQRTIAARPSASALAMRTSLTDSVSLASMV